MKGLVAGKKDSMKTQKSLMEELAGLHGQALAHEAQQQGVLHSRLQCANYSRLDRAMLCYVMQCIALHCIALHCIAIHCIATHGIALCFALVAKRTDIWCF